MSGSSGRSRWWIFHGWRKEPREKKKTKYMMRMSRRRIYIYIYIYIFQIVFECVVHDEVPIIHHEYRNHHFQRWFLETVSMLRSVLVRLYAGIYAGQNKTFGIHAASRSSFVTSDGRNTLKLCRSRSWVWVYLLYRCDDDADENEAPDRDDDDGWWCWGGGKYARARWSRCRHDDTIIIIW